MCTDFSESCCVHERQLVGNTLSPVHFWGNKGVILAVHDKEADGRLKTIFPCEDRKFGVCGLLSMGDMFCVEVIAGFRTHIVMCYSEIIM